MPFDNTTPPLSARGIASLRRFYAQGRNRPSDEIWGSLEDIAATIQAMADGSAENRVYLSSCDPGQGKTETVIHTTAALTADPAYSDVGVLIGVGRLSEAVAIAKRLREVGLPQGALAVATTVEEVNEEGTTGNVETSLTARDDIPGAQVLIVTQQRVDRLTRGRTFEDVSELHYQGQPRAVRVWDEAWLPGVAVSLDKWELGAPLSALVKRSRQMAEAVENLKATLSSAEDGTLLDIPNWHALYGVDRDEAIDAVASSGRDGQRVITLLYLLAGKATRVCKADGGNIATIAYRDTLPVDLMPLLVLDASGRVRQTYADIEEHRGIIKRLRSVTKDYSPLTVHTWKISGSKTAWTKKRETLIKGIVATINSKPDEEWLVVHHKAKWGIPSIAAAVAPLVTAKVYFTTWGRHAASNAWSQVPNVILAGAWYFPLSLNKATTHLAQGKPVDIHNVSPEEVRLTEIGEHKHHMLQALCRGTVRGITGNQCHPMNAYVIADRGSGIPAAIPEVFPHCTIKDWRPVAVERKISAKTEAAVKAVDELIDIGLPYFPESIIRDATNTKKANWGKLVADTEDYREELVSRGIRQVQAKGRPTILHVDHPAEEWSAPNEEA